MSSVVLDASALLAALLQEPGANVVFDAIESGAYLGAVNLAEVVVKLQELGVDEGEIRRRIGTADFELMEFDEPSAWRTGLLRRDTRFLGLSLGDRACVALGKALELPVLTAERRWTELDIGVEVRLCR